MTIEYRPAVIEDAEMLVNIYNASFYDDYMRFGSCPGYGNTKEMMEESILQHPKHIMEKAFFVKEKNLRNRMMILRVQGIVMRR